MKQLIKSILPKKFIKTYRSYKKNQERHKVLAKYKGDDVHCPICNSSFNLFADFGLIKRTNARCHKCGSLERHRLLYLYLTNTNNIFNHKGHKIKVLHFAPEKIFYDLFDANKNIEYTPCDLFPEQFSYNGTSEISKVDITKIPFEDKAFDFILCSHVLEHIPDDHLAMTELFRVMSDTGSGVFQVPIDYTREETYEDWSIVTPEEREKAFGQHDHVRLYGQDYKNRLKKVGFTVNEVDYPSTFSSDNIFKYGLMESEQIYHCLKSND